MRIIALPPSSLPRLILSLAALVTLPMRAQTPPLAGIAHVALRVKDLAASQAFYESLGFEQAFDLKRDGIPYVSFIKINDGQFLELYPAMPKDPTPGFLRLCFQGEDLQALHDDYLAHGLKPTDIHTSAAGDLLFTLAGPLQPTNRDGKALPQTIEYTQYLPESLHTSDLGQHLGPHAGADRIADRLLGVALAMIDPATAKDFYLNDLSFKPLPGRQNVMHLPGNSGEQIEITSAALGTHARITLQTNNLGRATHHLNHEHIKLQKYEEAVTFEDPDGNQIVLEQH